MRKLSLLTLFVAVVFSATVDAYGAVGTSAKPTPSAGSEDDALYEGSVEFVGPYAQGLRDVVVPLTPPLLKPAVDKYNYDDNFTYTGGRAVPPDPYVAAGPEHTINIGNYIIQWQRKDDPGVTESTQGLGTFFAAAPGYLGTRTFDPKVIYDQYSGRFVVVTLERIAGTPSAPANYSRIHIAVSMTPDPNLGWWFHSIDSKIAFVNPFSGLLCESWADYPGLGVDDKAVYITANMFGFANSPCGQSYGGGRLWIVNKAPTYAGPNGSIAFSVHNALAASGLVPVQYVSQQAAHMYGPLPVGSNGKPLGTYLTGYDGFTDCSIEFVVVIEVTDPLGGGGGPFFVVQTVPCGDLENVGCAFGWPAPPDAPQAGAGPPPGMFNFPIEVGDQRTYNAVWRENCLWTGSIIVPKAGVDAGNTTVHWWRIDTSAPAALVVADQGNIGSDDLGESTYTFYPQIMVDCNKNMAVGFAASNETIFCGAYYATRFAGDAPGSIGATGVLQVGLAYYHRFHGGTRNRWGDYSGLALCPVDEATFWIYNEYAGVQGTLGIGFYGEEDGRFQTKLGCFRVKEPTISVAITAFDARVQGRGVMLTGKFASSLEVRSINIYRGLGSAEAQILAQRPGSGDAFTFVDTDVRPGTSYRYMIGVVDDDGEFLSPIERVTIPAAEFELAQNQPNPFNPTTTINFTLASREHVTLSIYDATGRLVTTLVDAVRDVGRHEIAWNGKDANGQPVGSGAYFYRLDTGNASASKKMVLLK